MTTKRKMDGTEIINERFDERGDLTIICKKPAPDGTNSDREYNFLVRSAVLRLASPVWAGA